MFREKIRRLVKEYGVKHSRIMEILEISRGTYYQKIKDNSFTKDEQAKLNKHFRML